MPVIGEFMLKDPDAVNIPVGIDWSAWVTDNGSTTIDASTWVAEAGSEIALSAPTINGSETYVRMTGGTIGGPYRITNHITDDQGIEDDRSILVIVKER